MNPPLIMKKRMWRLVKNKRQPLYQQIEEMIMQHIQSGTLQPGDLLPSYPWLSKTMGVADKTVRQAYANLQQSGILEIMRGKGTFVARQRISKSDDDGLRTGTIGILPPPLPALASEDAIIWPILRSVFEASWQERMDALLLSRTGDLGSPDVAERTADPKRMDGLIILAPPAEEFLQRLVALQIPVVVARPCAFDLPADSVSFEILGAVRELTYRLIGEGHRAIGLIRIPSGQYATDLEAGYRHAMGTGGLPVHPSWVVNVDIDLGETGASAIGRLLDEGVSAVIAYNAALAMTVIDDVRRREWKIPKDLSVVCLAVEDFSTPNGVRVSGACFDPSELGKAAVRRMTELLGEDDTIVKREYIEARMVEGETVGKAKSR